MRPSVFFAVCASSWDPWAASVAAFAFFAFSFFAARPIFPRSPPPPFRCLAESCSLACRFLAVFAWAPASAFFAIPSVAGAASGSQDSWAQVPCPGALLSVAGPSLVLASASGFPSASAASACRFSVAAKKALHLKAVIKNRSDIILQSF